MTTTEKSVSLSLAAVDVLAEMLRSNVRQFPFQVPGLGELLEDRVRISGAVLADLQKRGLVRNGSFVPEIETGFRLLVDYQVAVAVMGTVRTDERVYARAHSDGRDAVLVRKQDQTMRFDVFRPENLVRGVVGLLGDLQAGPGQSVTINDVPEPAAPSGEDTTGGYFTQVQAPRSSAQSQLRGAEAIMQRPRTGIGQLLVSARQRDGQEVQAPNLSWLDTDAGRYLILTRRGQDGRTWGTFAPADNARLVHQVGELIQLVQGGPGR